MPGSQLTGFRLDFKGPFVAVAMLGVELHQLLPVGLVPRLVARLNLVQVVGEGVIQNFRRAFLQDQGFLADKAGLVIMLYMGPVHQPAQHLDGAAVGEFAHQLI